MPIMGIMGMEDMDMDMVMDMLLVMDMDMVMELLITPMDMLTVMLAALCMGIHHMATITMARGKLNQKLTPTLDMLFPMAIPTL